MGSPGGDFRDYIGPGVGTQRTNVMKFSVKIFLLKTLYVMKRLKQFQEPFHFFTKIFKIFN